MKATLPRRHPGTGKPMAATKATPPAHRDADYLAHVRKHDCKRCGKGHGIQAAHAGGLEEGKGWSRKVSDLRAIPLCMECHQVYDASEWEPEKWEIEGWIAELLFEYVGITRVDVTPKPPRVWQGG